MTTAVASSELKDRIAEVVGESYVTDKPFARVPYSRDQGVLTKGRLPDLVVRPGNTTEVQSILRTANETRTPVYLRGAYTSPFSYYPKEGGIVLDFTRMNRVIGIDEPSLTVTVEPGITWGELEAHLYRNGFRYLICPEGALGGTVGGHVSNRGSSPTSVLVANQGDCVTGLRVVLPNGDLVTTGSWANPAAHSHFMRYSFMSDLAGLFLGAEGTLGAIVEIGLKIEELPERTGHVAYKFNTVEQAAKALYVSRRKQIPTGAILVHDGKTLDLVDPANAPHAPYMVSWSHIMGTKVVVDDALARLDAICKAEGGENLGPGIPSRYWAERYRAAAGFLYVLGARMSYHWLVPLGEWHIYYAKMREMADQYMAERGVSITTTGHPCDRAFLAVMSAHCREEDPVSWQKARDVFQEMRMPLIEMGAGWYRNAIYYSADQLYRTGAYYELLKKIKNLIDPKRIMNPGFGGL